MVPVVTRTLKLSPRNRLRENPHATLPVVPNREMTCASGVLALLAHVNLNRMKGGLLSTVGPSLAVIAASIVRRR